MIKNKYMCTSYNIGYIGHGPYPHSIDNKPTPLYKLWHSMLRRCYSDKWLTRYPTYIGCTVVNEWHNFQHFAEWVHTIYPTGAVPKGMQLDKDIKVEDNKVYGPTTCMFVTRSENIKHSINKHSKTNDKIKQLICDDYSTGKYTQVSLADKYGLGQGEVSLIVRGILRK